MITKSIEKQLAESCGQVRPISLHVCNLQTRKVNKIVVSKPYLIIGRNAGCDLVLSHESVTKQHAYLQVLDGRLYCIDQASRTGIFWKDHPRLYGWLEQGEWIQIGPYRITLEQLVGDEHPAAKGRRNTTPFLARYQPDRGPMARLTVGDAIELPLSSQISIIGRSKYCNLELDDEDVSRFHASVIRTADGKYWLIDLNSRTVSHRAAERQRLDQCWSLSAYLSSRADRADTGKTGSKRTSAGNVVGSI
jgi:predicted component of type VI protein secretion system